MDYGPGKRIEEQEITEHYVTEYRRAVPADEREGYAGLPTIATERSFEEHTYRPGYRTASGTFIQSPNGAIEDESDRR